MSAHNIFHIEEGPGSVDVGRQMTNPEAPGVLEGGGKLFGIGDVEIHGGRQEGLGVMTSQEGGLEGDHCIGGRMRLVEAVVRKARDQIEDLLGDAGGDAARLGALEEDIPLGIHLGLDLLAHGPAQHVGAPSV